MNGWKNLATWNVAMFINNDEGLYRAAVRYASATDKPSYLGFIFSLGLEDAHTEDGVSWSSLALDLDALDEMMLELVELPVGA